MSLPVGFFIGYMVFLSYVVYKYAYILTDLKKSCLEKLIWAVLGLFFLITLKILFNFIEERIEHSRIEKNEVKKKEFYRKMESYEKSKRW